ncbi:hypothetical protein GCM10023093_27840 [Nemorincola caseinilytica]|uniref:Class I SAM-dependent methyltransferase n=1 Tax=Nemorincola caseinilytica TaxID=2054315 RepID=A0ABP8NKW9_9BACT
MSGRTIKLNITKFTKDFLLASRILQLLQPFNRLFAFIYDFNTLTSWIHRHKRDKTLMNDFYRPVRHYDDREKSFDAIVKHYHMEQAPIVYMEFGVAGGDSFKWWLKANKNADSRYYGLDTFEGLPESWGVFNKGDMIASIPQVNDPRAVFIKGIFQDTLNDLLHRLGPDLKKQRKVIHLDADIFSATLFALSQLYPYLNEGDIIMFDEFNVYGHEFKAFKLFTECFYIDLKLVSACNNFYHAAFEVVGRKEVSF